MQTPQTGTAPSRVGGAREPSSFLTRRGGRVAIVATSVTSVLVALLASTPSSPLTPDLFPGGGAPAFLARGSELLGLDRLPRDGAAVFSVVFLFAAAGAFVFALVQAWRGGVSLRSVLILGLALHALALAVPLFLSRDVYSYAIYGRMLSEHGANPYTAIPAAFASDPMYPLVSVDWIDSPSVYGPGFVVVSAAITSVVSSPTATVFAFKLVAALASVATMFLVAVAARRVSPERAAFAAALVGWNPAVLFHGVAGGHNDTLVGLALAGGVLLILARRDLWATAALALGTLVKVSGGVPLVAAVAASVLRRPRGERLRALALHAAVAVGVALPFVIPFEQTEDPTLGALELSTRQGWLAPSRFVMTLVRGAASAIGGDAAGGIASLVVRVAFPLAFAVVLVVLFRHLARDPARLDPVLTVATMGWATLIAVLISPLLYPWYVAWLVPLIWLLPGRARIGGVVVCVALAITELVAEPSRAPVVWEAMVFGLHYIATPAILVVLVRLLLDLRRRLELAPAAGWSDPLLLESVPARSSERERVSDQSDRRYDDRT